MFENDPILDQYRRSIDLTNFPRGFLRQFEHLDATTKENWYRERYQCLKSHLFLSGYALEEKAGDDHLPPSYTPILGMDFQPDPHNRLFELFLQKRPGEGKVIGDLDLQTKKRMILWPRGLFKTSAVIVDIVQTILNYPNVRICFLTGGDELAKRQLARVKHVFEKPTKRFRTLFPEFCLTSKPVKRRELDEDSGKTISVEEWEDFPAKFGTQHEFTVPCRTNFTFAEPTFAISTARSVKAGSHWDFIFIDDLVNETNYRSVKLLTKCYDDYLAICPLLDPNGYIVMTGTRYSYGDTYERIQEKAQEEEREIGRSIWKFSIRDCWSYACQHCKHTSVYHDYDRNIVEPPCIVPGCGCIGFKQVPASRGVLFPVARTKDGRPVGHTMDFLEGERIRLGPEFFANQYENCPIAEGAQVFTETMIGAQTVHRMEDVPPFSASDTFIMGDLAYVGQPDRDFSVLYVFRRFQGRLTIFKCEFGNWDSGAVAENVVNLLWTEKPNMMYFERFNGWEAYDRIIRFEASKRGITQVPIQWEKMSTTENAKLIRIGSIKGVLTAKRLWFYSAMKGYQQMVQQLTKWPKLGRHDDFADCVGMVVAAPTGYELGDVPVDPSALNWLKQYTQTAPPTQDYGDGGCGTGLNCGPGGDKDGY